MNRIPTYKTGREGLAQQGTREQSVEARNPRAVCRNSTKHHGYLEGSLGENIVSVSGELTECLGHQAEAFGLHLVPSPGNLLDMRIFRLLTRPSEGETPRGLGQESRFYQALLGMLTPPPVGDPLM